MYDEEYFEEMVENLFGEYWDDDVKSETICFRVSKKAKEYFVSHANGKYGSTQKAMESIFKEYMESIDYKRGKVNQVVVLLIPKFYSKKDLDEIKDFEIIDFDDDGFWHEKLFDEFSFKLIDNFHNDVVVKSYDPLVELSDYDKYYFNENLDIDGFEINLDDYIIIPFHLNNHLDVFKDGVYKTLGGSHHTGLIISQFNDIDFYIRFYFEMGEQPSFNIITNEKAFDLAIEVNNENLAKTIASFKDINSKNADIESLKYKKEQLEKQISDINNRIEKLQK